MTIGDALDYEDSDLDSARPDSAASSLTVTAAELHAGGFTFRCNNGAYGALRAAQHRPRHAHRRRDISGTMRHDGLGATACALLGVIARRARDRRRR